MSLTPPYEKRKLYQIPITDFTPDPEQPRKVIDPEALQRLMTNEISPRSRVGRHRREDQDHRQGHPHDQPTAADNP